MLLTTHAIDIYSPHCLLMNISIIPELTVGICWLDILVEVVFSVVDVVDSGSRTAVVVSGSGTVIVHWSK